MSKATTVYEIRVRDHLDTCWADWFEGWEITNLEGGDVLLTNAAADQSALHGALIKVRDLNLKLISVVSVDHALEAGVSRAEMQNPVIDKKDEEKGEHQ